LRGASRVKEEGDPPLIRESEKLEKSRVRANVTVTQGDGAGSSLERGRDNAGIKRIKSDEAKANVTDELGATTTQETALSKAPTSNFHTVASVATVNNLTVAPLRDASRVKDEGDPSLIRGSKLEKSEALATDESKANVTKNGSSFEDRRFPKYGTAAFIKRCPWATQNPVKKRNCAILARPLPPFQEGVSNWVAQIAAGRILAQQTGCDFLMDYAYSRSVNKAMDVVNIHEVLTPFTNHDSGHPPINWTVPSGFNCIEGRLCFVAQPGYNHRGDSLTKIENALGTGNLSDTPMYRFGYAMSESQWLYADMFRDLERSLSGYTVETGMACAIGSVFELAPAASQFEPELFSRILPALYSRDALVMSLYIRTNQADFNTHQEEKGGGKFAPEDTTQHLKAADKILKCALHLEKEQLQERSYSRVVWMVVTDSQYLKRWLTESYDTRYANATASDSTIGREVVTTRSRGVHTRSRRGPSTADFAEAMIDWYLIGESDLVVSDDRSVSFGGTATLRTARPLYKPPFYDNSYVCSRAVLVHARDNASAS
jgi:hypothetical protein